MRHGAPALPDVGADPPDPFGPCLRRLLIASCQGACRQADAWPVTNLQHAQGWVWASLGFDLRVRGAWSRSVASLGRMRVQA